MHPNLTGRSKPAAAAVALASIALAIGACQTPAADTTTAPQSTTTAASPSPVAVQSLIASIVPEASPSSEPSPSPTSSDSGIGAGSPPPPGAIDPCSLLTKVEASKLMGKTLGAGVSTTLDPDRVCTWKNGLSEVKLILAPPAPDVATAASYWDAERAQVPAEVHVKDLSMFDRSAYGSGSAGGLSLSALFVIDGNQFFDLYCGLPACSEKASAGAAELIAGRLP
jgi:hypothetical protein